MSELTSLTRLNLAANSYSDISPLSGLTNLTFLAINGSTVPLSPGEPHNGKVTDISALSGMTSMTLLWIGDNPISDISALSGMTSLETLHAFDNLITDVSALEGITSVTRFNLDRNADLANIQPLLDNMELGAGDQVNLRGTNVSCPDVLALQAKGVSVTSDCP